MRETDQDFETWAVRAKPALWLAIGFFVLLAVSIGATFGFYRLELPGPKAPPPRAFPKPDWELYLRHEGFQLPNPAPPSGYGWTDRAQGRVHIPIARAMQLVALKGDHAWDPLEQGPAQ